MKTLAGDRAIEWGWAMDHLPVGEGNVLDLGPMDWNLSSHAALKGYQVTAIGVEHLPPPPEGIEYIRQDVLVVNLGDKRFICILDTSTSEHIGLGRYGDPINPNGDLETMAKLRGWMLPNARHILTIPIGQDAVIGSWHRVYGEERLPRLLEGYKVLLEQFWVKQEDDSAWIECTKERALNEIPGQVPEPSMINLSYALGLFVLGLS